MSRIRSIITILIALSIVLAVSTQSYAATTTEWTDEETGFKFNMITSSNGKVTSRLVTGSGKYTTDTDEYLAAKQRANAKAAEMEKANGKSDSSSSDKNEKELKLEKVKEVITEDGPEIKAKVTQTIDDVKTVYDLANNTNAYCIEKRWSYGGNHK